LSAAFRDPGINPGIAIPIRRPKSANLLIFACNSGLPGLCPPCPLYCYGCWSHQRLHATYTSHFNRLRTHRRLLLSASLQ